MGYSLRIETMEAIIGAQQASNPLTEGVRISAENQQDELVLNSAPLDLCLRYLAKTGVPVGILREADAEYPPALQGARRADFVRQIEQVNNRVGG